MVHGSGKQPSASLSLAPETATYVLAEFKDRFVRDPVVNMKTLLPPPEYAGLSQGLKMTGNIGLGSPDLLDQGGDGGFLFNQGMNQPETHRLGQKFETIGHQLQKCIRRGSLYSSGRFGRKRA